VPYNWIMFGEEMSDFSWSYSAYSSAVTCLRKFKLSYIEKVVVDGPESSDLIFGSALHSAINAVLTNEDGIGTFELYWESYREKDVEYGRHDWKQLKGLGTEFIRKFTKTYAPSLRLDFAEQRLYSDYRGVKVDGQPDFIGEFNGVRTLADWKTSSANYAPTKANTATQLYLYAYLAIKNGHGPIEQLAYFVFNKGTGSLQTPIVWKFNEADMYEALNNLIDYAYILGPTGISDPALPMNYPKNYDACHNYNRPCKYFSICHPTKESK